MYAFVWYSYEMSKCPVCLKNDISQYLSVFSWSNVDFVVTLSLNLQIRVSD